MSEEKSKPAFDEQALDKLLEAAFVLQEHNRKSQEIAQQFERTRDRIESEDQALEAKSEPLAEGTHAAPARGDYTLTLGKVLDTQRQIQVRQLDLLSAISLIAERLVEVSSGSGAAVAVVDGQFVHYRGVAGSSAPEKDSTVPAEKALCSSSVSTGQVLRCADARVESALNREECARRNIRSLIAVPVFFQGNVTGAVELYYAEPEAFAEQDIHTCQLMAGLVTEALVRDEEATWKKSLESERAAMLEALEKLQPSLAALVETPKHDTVAISERAGSTARCRRCGHELLSEEKFCGECGSPQNEPAKIAEEPLATGGAASNHKGFELPMVDTIGTGTPSELESGMVQAPIPDIAPQDLAEPEHSAGGGADEENLDFTEMLRASGEAGSGQEAPPNEADDRASEPATTLDPTAIEKVAHPADWSSAAAAKDFLERLTAKQGSGSFAEFWSRRRGDIYLAISVILVICVILWAMMNHSAGANATQGSATTTHAKSPEPTLSFSDRVLIRLGLAEAPQPPEDRGNPATQVWVDQRTALYYCPGSDLYEKTQKGKFMSQRDAQLDQFEPAYRKPCN